MRVLLVQLDGKMPNVALMRLAAAYRDVAEIDFRHWARVEQVAPELGRTYDHVFASAIFERSAPLVAEVLRQFPHAIVGGTGSGSLRTLEDLGVNALDQDYGLYPTYRQSIGFSQRGCRLRCSFCVVPRKEGAIREERTIAELWRGDPWPRELVLLDNDFFGQPRWRERIAEIRDGGFKVSFSQGINVRAIGDEEAAALASVQYRDDSMTRRQLCCAWDNKKDEARLFAGLQRLVDHGVRPAEILVYMLVGYWPGETAADREYRRAKLREFGAFPYPMPYVRTPELVGFQRWVVGAYDKRGIPWADWCAAGYRPERLGRGAATTATTLGLAGVA